MTSDQPLFELCLHNFSNQSTERHPYICTCIQTYICMYVHTCIRTYICTYICTYIHTYIHTYICKYTYVSIVHTYIHTYVRTYVHMCTVYVRISVVNNFTITILNSFIFLSNKWSPVELFRMANTYIIYNPAYIRTYIHIVCFFKELIHKYLHTYIHTHVHITNICTYICTYVCNIRTYIGTYRICYVRIWKF